MSHKILVTGHTSGIGEIIYNGFENIRGVSRSEGYDISNTEQANSIVSLAKEYDIFINNAFNLVKQWKRLVLSQEKLLIFVDLTVLNGE